MKKVIIIGAGILGASTAYQLTKQGAQVTIIDRQEAGQATSAATGIICPWLSQRRNKAWYHLAKSGARLYPQLVQELQDDGESETGYAQVGAISIRDNEERLRKMQELAVARREDAPEIGDVTLLTPEQTRELFPLLDEKYGAVHISGAARVNGALLNKALLQAAEKHGAEIVHGDATLNHENGKVTGVNVSNQFMQADRFILTTGAWMNDLLAPLGVVFQGTAQRGQLVYVQVPNRKTSHWPVVMPPSDQAIVPFDNHIVLGATHEDEVGFDHRVTAGAVHEVLEKAFRFAPGLADSTFVQAKVAFRPFTPGFLPVVGPLPGHEEVILANGLGASGLTTGPFVGLQLAKLALGKEIDIQLEDYDVAGAIAD
ncbi:D-amino acid dehydrogenase small subunit [Oceanobacillus limi]|uniref:D-amino acid dehydrogenase small subunit n=1 Tax=Oceanobacillus limi TaxID=930131 RepID=A0A1H9Y897_9BACI|nr:FAD-dependent oxidoreductase [Oceanobacillus limi]SES65043.1 D-amino acid dehydrogenase small subunit [Oceanobacillus limi]